MNRGLLPPEEYPDMDYYPDFYAPLDVKDDAVSVGAARIHDAAPVRRKLLEENARRFYGL